MRHNGFELDIKLHVHRDCLLTAFDHTFYDEAQVTDIVKHVLVEFMCYLPYSSDSEIVAIQKSKKVTFFKDNSHLSHEDRKYNYTFDKDGRYSYHKYLLYTVEHPYIHIGDTYYIKDKVFYHDGKIYFGLQNVTELVFDSLNTKVIYNWYDLDEYVSLSIDHFFEKEIFTFCKLERCLFELQRKVFFDGLKNCNFGECNADKVLKLHRDFLFASVYILSYLTDIGNYLEAQRIIESLATCGSLCDDSLKNNKRCGCG